MLIKKSTKPTVDLAPLAGYLEQNDTGRAKELLQAFLSAPLSPEDRAAIQADFVSAVLKLENQIDSTYLEELQSILNSAILLADAEKTTKEKLDLLQVRASLR